MQNDGSETNLPNSPFRDIDLTGQTVDDVVVERQLRVTQFYQLYRGVQKTIERTVLFKLWRPLKSKGDLQHRGIHEAKALSNLRHPNVITLYDSGLYEGKYPYLVTEYLSGGSLREELETNGPLNLTRALGVLQQIASALEEIHHHSMLHRNLSSQCILFESLAGSGQELVKISDMDMAKLGTEEDPNDSALPELSRFAPRYMAPEQILGGTISGAIDLYACGVLLYEMLTGRLPYNHPAPPELWDEIVTGTPRPVASLVPKLRGLDDLQNLVDLLLAKRPEARLDNARHLRLFATELLDELLDDMQTPWTQEVESFPAIATSLHAKAPPLNPPPVQSKPTIKPQKRIPPAGTRISPPTRPGRNKGQENDQSARPRPDIQPRRKAPQPQPITPKGPTSGMNEANRRRRQASLLIGPEAHKKVPRTRPGGLNHIFWIGPVPKRLDSAKGLPYLIIAAESKAQVQLQANSRLSGGTPILLHAKLSSSFVLMAVPVPSRLTEWLQRISEYAEQNHLTVGLIYDQSFPGRDAPPSERLSRNIIGACTRGKAGWLLASQATVETLGASQFSPLDGDTQGRYSSLMRYTGNRA